MYLILILIYLIYLQALLELEMNSDLKQQLRELYITGAKVHSVKSFNLLSLSSVLTMSTCLPGNKDSKYFSFYLELYKK